MKGNQAIGLDAVSAKMLDAPPKSDSACGSISVSATAVSHSPDNADAQGSGTVSIGPRSRLLTVDQREVRSAEVATC